MTLGCECTFPSAAATCGFLLSLDAILSEEPCCFGACAHGLGELGMARQWKLYEKASSFKEQDLVLLRDVLWSDAFGRPTPWCNSYFALVFGVGDGRIANLRRVLAVFGGGGALRAVPV